MKTFKLRKPQIPDFKAVARALSQGANGAMHEMVLDFAGVEAATFKRMVEDQEFDSFDAHPLSPRWVARKIANNADVRTMIATKHYLNRIRVITKKTGPRTKTVYVGFDADDRARDLDGQLTDLPLYALAEIHEEGSAAANIPARPHWGPHLLQMRERAKGVRANILKAGVAAAKGAI